MVDARLSIGMGLVLGLMPALEVTRATLRHSKVRSAFMLVQVTASVALLLLTATLVSGFQRTAGTDLGFDAARVFAVSMDPARDGHSDQSTAEFYDRLLRRMERAPYVSAAALTESVPFAGGGSDELTFSTEASAVHSVRTFRIGPNYFDVLSIPVLRRTGVPTR